MSRTIDPDESVGPCAHPNSETRLRTLANGTTAIYDQCTTCGASTSAAKAKSKFKSEQIKALPAFDDHLPARYRAMYAPAAGNAEERSQRYQAYLLSPEWRAKRERVFKRDKHLCQGCLDERATQVHHLNYNHIFREPLFDLISVCEKCHLDCHFIPWE